MDIGRLIAVGLAAALCLWVGVAPWVVALVATLGLVGVALERRSSAHLVPRGALVAGGIAAGIVCAVPANAAPASWVEDESSFICLELSSSASYPNLLDATITILQQKHNIGREETVAGMRQAAQLYCPRNLSAVPAR
jgi:hypothetical protein